MTLYSTDWCARAQNKQCSLDDMPACAWKLYFKIIRAFNAYFIKICKINQKKEVTVKIVELTCRKGRMPRSLLLVGRWPPWHTYRHIHTTDCSTSSGRSMCSDRLCAVCTSGENLRKLEEIKKNYKKISIMWCKQVSLNPSPHPPAPWFPSIQEKPF